MKKSKTELYLSKLKRYRLYVYFRHWIEQKGEVFKGQTDLFLELEREFGTTELKRIANIDSAIERYQNLLQEEVVAEEVSKIAIEDEDSVKEVEGIRSNEFDLDHSFVKFAGLLAAKIEDEDIGKDSNRYDLNQPFDLEFPIDDEYMYSFHKDKAEVLSELHIRPTVQHLAKELLFKDEANSHELDIFNCRLFHNRDLLDNLDEEDLNTYRDMVSSFHEEYDALMFKWTEVFELAGAELIYFGAKKLNADLEKYEELNNEAMSYISLDRVKLNYDMCQRVIRDHAEEIKTNPKVLKDIREAYPVIVKQAEDNVNRGKEIERIVRSLNISRQNASDILDILDGKITFDTPEAKTERFEELTGLDASKLHKWLMAMSMGQEESWEEPINLSPKEVLAKFDINSEYWEEITDVAKGNHSFENPEQMFDWFKQITGLDDVVVRMFVGMFLDALEQEDDEDDDGEDWKNSED